MKIIEHEKKKKKEENTFNFPIEQINQNILEHFYLNKREKFHKINEKLKYKKKYSIYHFDYLLLVS